MPPSADYERHRYARKSILIHAERKRQDRSARHAEKHLWWSKTPRVHGLNRPNPPAQATANTAQGEKHLSSGQTQGTVPLCSILLGECRDKERFSRSSDTCPEDYCLPIQGVRIKRSLIMRARAVQKVHGVRVLPFPMVPPWHICMPGGAARHFASDWPFHRGIQAEATCRAI